MTVQKPGKRSVSMFALAVAAIAAFAGAAAGAQDAPRALTVRLYNASGIPAAEMLAAQRAVTSIFEGTGVNVMLRPCGRQRPAALPSTPAASRSDPRNWSSRVMNAPAFSTWLHAEAYGLAYIVRETNRGWLATVFSDRIGSASARLKIDSGTLLGLVMAHEIGHLLPGVDYHGASGVMRVEFPDGLMDSRRDEWHFSGREAARLRRAAADPF